MDLGSFKFTIELHRFSGRSGRPCHSATRPHEACLALIEHHHYSVASFIATPGLVAPMIVLILGLVVVSGGHKANHRFPESADVFIGTAQLARLPEGHESNPLAPHGRPRWRGSAGRGGGEAAWATISAELPHQGRHAEGR